MNSNGFQLGSKKSSRVDHSTALKAALENFSGHWRTVMDTAISGDPWRKKQNNQKLLMIINRNNWADGQIYRFSWKIAGAKYYLSYRNVLATVAG